MLRTGRDRLQALSYISDMVRTRFVRVINCTRNSEFATEILCIFTFQFETITNIGYLNSV
jgi:hypothetical protein